MVERTNGAVYNVICEYHTPYYGKTQHMNNPTKDDTLEKMWMWADLVPSVKALKVNSVAVQAAIKSGRGVMLSYAIRVIKDCEVEIGLCVEWRSMVSNPFLRPCCLRVRSTQRGLGRLLVKVGHWRL